MNQGFDSIAPFYDALARLVFGNAIRKSQLIFLSKLQECKSVLVIGGGTGWWLKDLIAINPNIKITLIDASSKMIQQARKKTSSINNVQFIHGTLEETFIEAKHDAVILFYFLDIYGTGELTSVIQNIMGKLRRDALWLVTDFVEEKKWHSVFLKIMYVFFHFITGLSTHTLPNWKKVLADSKLRLVEEKTFYGDFIFSSYWK
jgi:ubiquinone/menaquinone biosynthesis C-methylase UbiE